jgi:hypothetical protein
MLEAGRAKSASGEQGRLVRAAEATTGTNARNAIAATAICLSADGEARKLGDKPWSPSFTDFVGTFVGFRITGMPKLLIYQ